MQEPAVIDHRDAVFADPAFQPIERITAIWALSEAALGGLLHALHIPLTGLFIGGSAVLFITLISFFTRKPGAILKATMIVMIVKLLASPHSPINAYFAVAFQGLAGELIFRMIKNKRSAAFSLGLISLLQSAFQKIIVVTLVFGQSIWEAIDLFSDYVLTEFFVSPEFAESFSLSAVLIVIYVGIHLTGGIVFGLWAPALAKHVRDGITSSGMPLPITLTSGADPVNRPKSRRRKIWKRFSYMLIISVALMIFVLSYFIPVFEQSKGMSALIMIVRSILIMTIWFYAVGPFLMKRLRHFLSKKESAHQREVQDILNLLPILRGVVQQSWQTIADKKNFRTFGVFIENLIRFLLTVDLSSENAQDTAGTK